MWQGNSELEMQNSEEFEFSPNDIEWLIMIRDLIKLGVSIPTIRILLIAKFPTNLSKLQEKDLEIIELLLKLKSHAVYSTIFYN